MDTRVVELAANEIELNICGQRVAAMRVPSGYVPLTFNPLIEEHQVVTGDQLRNGFIVLLADSNYRENPDRIVPAVVGSNNVSPQERNRVAETSRWAIVTNLKSRPRTNLITFDGIYADGTAIPRIYNETIKWAVLKEMDVQFFIDESFKKFFGDFYGQILDDLGYEAHLGYSVGSTEIRSDDQQAPCEPDYDRWLAERSQELSRGEVQFISDEEQAAHDEVFGYCAKDAEMTQRLYEAIKPPKKQEWLKEVPANDLWLGDFLPVGGTFHTITEMIKNIDGDITIILKRTNGSALRILKLVVREDDTFDVKRRYKQK
jgi:hypothetical protein